MNRITLVFIQKNVKALSIYSLMFDDFENGKKSAMTPYLQNAYVIRSLG